MIRAEISETDTIFNIKKPEKIYKTKIAPCKYNKTVRLLARMVTTERKSK